MYQDQESIKVFERMHARDRMAEAARHLDKPSDDGYDLFESHARAEAKDGNIGIILSITAFAALLGIAILVSD